ncbi:MAG: serine protease inhibitor [Synechococcus sp. EAC657]|nr:serine protease inhibitor [Synechococcus sp. EAC657]MEC7247664.1 serine protease inhibitor [Cyanobacteriota bacterium]
MLPSCDGSRVIRASERQWIPLGRLVKALVASALLGAAFLLAPEQPEQQASICQQHHSVEACRVW